MEGIGGILWKSVLDLNASSSGDMCADGVTVMAGSVNDGYFMFAGYQERKLGGTQWTSRSLEWLEYLMI